MHEHVHQWISYISTLLNYPECSFYLKLRVMRPVQTVHGYEINECGTDHQRGIVVINMWNEKYQCERKHSAAHAGICERENYCTQSRRNAWLDTLCAEWHNLSAF